MNDVHRRFCNGDERGEVAVKLEKEKPRGVKLNMLQNIDKEWLEAGNRNRMLRSTILRKISSKNGASNDLDHNFMMYIKKLQDKYETLRPHNKYAGHIQNVSFKPFFLILYTIR